MMNGQEAKLVDLSQDTTNHAMVYMALNSRRHTTGKSISPVSYSHYGPPPIVIGSEIIGVLSVSPTQHDHDTLASLLSREQWRIHVALSLRCASAFLRAHEVPLVICEHDLLPGSWTELLDEIRRLSIPPYLIVTSRIADDYLWAEALNMGAYDVLAKPFDVTEVTRILSLALLHWKRQYSVLPMSGRLMAMEAVA
jgi:CheY-like chemotaxis protein